MIRLAALVLVALLSALPASAQTVTPQSLGIQFSAPVTVSPLNKTFSLVTRFWDSAYNGNSVHWGDIDNQPTCGTYTWTALDAMVNQAVAAGTAIIYTFGWVPGCANGNQAKYVPPTNNQYLYNFVTALVTRYKGKIKYYSIWNEMNIGATVGYWTGTVAQMFAIGQVLYPLIKSIDPNAIVLTPSVAGFSATLWMQQYLALGGGQAGVTADGIDFHTYQIRYVGQGLTPNTTPNEQNWLVCQYLNAMNSYYDTPTLPLYASEGGSGWDYNNPGGVAQETQVAALWPVLMTSCPFATALWYAYDELSPSQFANFWDGGTWLNQQGSAYRVAQTWLAGATFTAPFARTAGTNKIRNPTFSGASAPDTPGTNMSISNGDAAYGMSSSIAPCSENGIPCIDWTVAGTPTAGASGQIALYLETNNQIADTLGQQWNLGADIKLQGGSLSGVTPNIAFNENGSGGSYLGVTEYFSFPPIPAPLQNDIQVWPAVTTQAGTAYVQPYIALNYSVGTPVNITLRIGAPFMDTGSKWSAAISKPGGYVGLIIEDSAGGPTTYTASASTYPYWRDLTGAQYANPGTVTLTGQPILLENQVAKGWAP